MIDWKVVEDTFFAWALALSNYAANKIIWKSQNGSDPGGDYITLSLSDMITVGQDCLINDYDPMRPAGQEYRTRVEGDRDFAIIIETYTDSTVNDVSGRAVCAHMQTRAQLPGMRAILDGAGISQWDAGTITYLPAIKEVEFKGRGVLTIRMYVRDQAEEFGTWIEKVEMVDTATGDVIEIP